MLTAERLRELLDYDPETGLFLWRIYRGGSRKAGVPFVGSIDSKGHANIYVDGCAYGAHRLAFLHVNGRWPTHEIDHKNRIRADNRIANLREATTHQNAQNARRKKIASSGTVGVYRHSPGKWTSFITANGTRHYLGLFDTIEAAAAARRDAVSRLHGTFACHG